jgi:hypothetical protein
MPLVPLIAIVAGAYVGAVTGARALGRYWWARRTYGSDLGPIDTIDTVMTPGMWLASLIAILLIVAGFGSLP